MHDDLNMFTKNIYDHLPMVYKKYANIAVIR